MNSSKIVLNTSASFSSLRIENPKKAGLLTKESESNLKLFLSSMPLVNELFSIQNMVGEGTFSKVYRAKHNQSQVDFALKCVIPTIKPSRIIPELRYLRDMGGDSNIIELKTCLFQSGYTIIVMPFFQHDRFSDYIKVMDLNEIKDYMRNLLIALKKVHHFKVIHRDIKPNNFLYNRTERKYALVDFGLAQLESDVLKSSKAINRLQSSLMNNQINKKYPHQQQIKIKSNHHQLEHHSSTVQTANSLFKNKDNKVVCVRKRLLTENDDENVFPYKFKKLKHDSPLKSIYRSTVFNTPTKQRPANAPVLGQLTNSPNLIIPETPPKSSHRSDKKVSTLKLTNLFNPPSSNCTITTNTTMTTNFNKSTTTTATFTTKSNHKSSNANFLSNSLSNVSLSCKCFGLDQICKTCAKRNECMAPRAGTPGFRAPEVLLKHLCQTSAIDIWSSGVIFASLLTKKYPFFRNTDDMTSLAEIISIFGSERVQKAAESIGKHITSSEKNVPPVDLKETLTKLREDQMEIEDSAFDLLDKLLDPSPTTRITAADALNHPFLKN